MALITCPDCNQRLYTITSECPTCGYPFSTKRTKDTRQSEFSDIFLAFVIIALLPVIGLYGTDIIANTGIWFSSTPEARYEYEVGRLQVYFTQCTTGDPVGGNADRCVYLQDLVSRGYVDNIPAPPEHLALVHKFNLDGYHKLEIKPIKKIKKAEKNCDPDRTTCTEIHF